MCTAVSNCLFVFKQRPDEEAVVDQGGTSTILNIHYEKEELEGKNHCFV
jgi:sodium bicarbonate cotransporter 8